MYTQVSMTSYCALLAQQRCEWVAQWDIDEFLYLPGTARLLDFVKRVPAIPTRCCLSSILCRCLPTRLFLARLVVECCAISSATQTPWSHSRRCSRPTTPVQPMSTRFTTTWGKKDTSLNRSTIAHYAVQSRELYMLKYRDVNLGKLFDNSSLSIDAPNQE